MTDAIDKVIPSFALLLFIIVALLVYLTVIFFLPVIAPKPGTISLTVKDTDKNPLEGAAVLITYGGKTYDYKTSEDGTIADFNVFMGDKITKVSVEKEGYKFKTPSEGYYSDIEIKTEKKSLSFTLEEIITTKEVAIRLVDSESKGLLSGKAANAVLKCTDPDLESPGSVTIENGFYTAVIPKNCILTADVVMSGYKRKNATVGSDGIIELQADVTIPPEPVTGDFTVNLFYEKERAKRVAEEITVSLYRVEDLAQDAIPIDNDSTSSGQVQFKELEPGKYKVKSTATSTLTGEESAAISVNAGDKKTASLYLKDRIVGQIKVKVIDATSKAAVKDARLTLKKDQAEIESALTATTGEYSFNLRDDTKYNLVIDKEGYCLKKLSDLTKGDDVKQISLTKYTGLASQCGGSLNVKVQDEAGNSIQGAVVMLFDNDGYYVGTKRVTDINGYAKFTGIGNGTYKAFAFRGYSKGWSETTEYSVREGAQEDLTVTMTVQNGTINVRVVDEDGRPLQYSFVTVKKAQNDKKIEGPKIVENEDGTISFEVIAGEAVFFVVQKDGYATLVSQPVTVEPAATKDLNFVLEIMRISGGIEGEFLGLYKNGKIVSIAGAGEEYVAKFRLSMPDNSEYDRVGLHVRTGYESKMELDHIYIKEEMVPGNPDILKGTSFDKSQGINADSQFLSADGSKWMNFEWSNYTKGKIYVELIIKVKDTAKADTELPIFWRAWAEDGTTVLRDPADITLGTSESTAGLYAEAYKKTFQVGTETLCSDKWCYSVKILDIEEDLAQSVDETYSAKVGKPYRLSFSVLNNSKSETDTFQGVTAKAWNPEESITIGTYNFTGELSVDGNAQGSETPEVSIGNLPPSREVKGTLLFTPQASISSAIMFRLHDPNRHENIFEKSITIDILAAEQFKILFEKDGEYQDSPPTLPSGIENELKVKVQRLRDGLEVAGATVKLQNKFGDTLSQTTTTGLGIAAITIPILVPGEKLFIVAEKPDYQALKKEITVDTSVLGIEPEKTAFNLDVIEQLPDTKTITLTNLTQMELTISDIQFTGEFDGLVDEEKANEWLYSEYVGKKIASKETLEISSKVELSDLGKLTETGQSLNGKITFTVSSMGHSWVFSNDTTVTIALGGEVDDPNCFTLDKASWQATIQSQEAATDIKVSNSCTVKGQPVELKNISAKIEWKSNKLGDVWVKIQDIAVELRGNYPKLLRGSLDKESDITGMLSFLPDAGVVGTAEATITVTAEHATSGGTQVLSDSMGVSIKIVNMAGCLKFSKDLVKIMEGEEGSFTIEATENCGGTVGLKLDTDLTIPQKEFSMKQGETKEITVLSEENYPGAYPIYVFMKGAGLKEYSFAKLVSVIIDTDGCIRLSKYEYDIQDCSDNLYDGFDTGKIINVCHSKTINAEVKFNEKNLWDAFLGSWPWALGGFIYGGINAMAEGKTFWGTDKPETTCSNAGLEYCSGKMMCKNDNIKQVKNVICCASECVDGEKGASVRGDLCTKKGYTYCGTGKCVGEQKPVSGIYCCQGKCQAEFETEAFMKICKDNSGAYCNEGEECSEDFEWFEGVKCCTGKCETPENTPQMMACAEKSAKFCNEKNGWACPDKKELIYEEKGIKCCSADCIKSEDATYSEPEKETEAEDTTCMTKGAKYDFCQENEECLGGETEEVEGIECCQHICTNPEDSDYYEKTCSAFDSSYHFCDGVTSECTAKIQKIGDDDLPCCTAECESMFNEEDGTAKPKAGGGTGQATEADSICKNTALDGDPNYDHCEAGEACFQKSPTVIGGTDCCLHKCVDNAAKVDEYQAACKSEGWTYCTYIDEDCDPENQVLLQAADNKGLPCCKAACTPRDMEKQGSGNYYFNCKSGEPAAGAKPRCSGTPGEIVIDTYQGGCLENTGCSAEAGCLTTTTSYKKCEPNQTCEEGANGAECKDTPGTGTGTGGGTTTGGTSTSTGSLTEKNKVCTDGGHGNYCPTGKGYGCWGRCLQCQGVDPQAYIIGSINTTCCQMDTSGGGNVQMSCYLMGSDRHFPKDSEGRAIFTPYTESGTANTSGTPTTVTLTDRDKCSAVLCKGGAECDEVISACPSDGTCSTCTLSDGTCHMQNVEVLPQTVTYNGETIYCCPAPGNMYVDDIGEEAYVKHECLGSASAQGVPENGMPVAMASTGGSLLDLGGSLLGTLNSSINSLIGIDNPWMGAVVGAIAGTLYNYNFVQQEGTLPYVTTATDMNILSVNLVIPMGLEEQAESQIIVQTGDTTKKADKDYPLGREETEIVFKNNGLTQAEPYKPVFRTLKVDTNQYDYNTQFEVKKKEDAEALKTGEFLTVTGGDGATQKFHLQFNAYCAKEIEPAVVQETSCMIGDMTGTTGPNALPKVLFRWDWSNVKDNTCDEAGDGTYCDATQFSIELLKKIQAVDTLLRGQTFACPAIEGAVSDKSQDLSTDDLDVGITRIRVVKDGKNAKVIGTIESNNQTEMTVKAVISLTKKGTATPIACPEAANGEKAVQLTSREEIDCTFSNLTDGVYTASMQISPQVSTCKSGSCKDTDAGNNTADVTVVVGSGVPEKCEPYSTARLAEYSIANPNNSNLSKALELTNFKANLIMDGYTNDFRNDFDEFAQSKDFFGTPSYYKGDTGLWKYFKNPELLKFDSSFLRPESGYLRSGKYQVRIEIEYKDSSWSLFKETEPNAVITVKLNLLSHPDPDSPFYYMPFDGLVGADSGNGRQGYGVNYRQESLATIQINEDSKQLLRTSTIAPSSPLPGGWVYTAENNNFRTLNNDKRGVVLDVEHTASDSTIILSPSNATPLLLKVSGGKSDRAWAYYSMTVDGEPQITGSYLTTWTGIVRGCKDFTDNEIVETYMNRKDMHGGISSEQSCSPTQRKSDYGLEWCEVTRQGSVFLKTVLFTPQGSESTIELTDSQDSASFIAPTTAGGTTVMLNGVYDGSIDSVEKVFELVKAEDICVAGTGNSAKTVFFWNPKVIIEKSLQKYIDNATGECIQPKSK
ncbi:MAG: hypothetical protein NT067_07430 [Candidatus Diapherotrites archaeon]|nr:hypothetical protein [Candidatus Diapherotrites archaeon]